MEGGGEGEEAVEGGEGGATQEEAAEGGAAVETAWAPQDTEELLDAIATQDYGVSDDRSSKLTVPAAPRSGRTTRRSSATQLTSSMTCMCMSVCVHVGQ